MRAAVAFGLLGALSATGVQAAPAPVTDERFPYTGPDVPVGDWVDNTVNGNGKGFTRLVEAPAVIPAKRNPTNNVNVISLAYIPNGMNVHYQTPFGLGAAPEVRWGKNKHKLNHVAKGHSHTYDRTPSCSEVTLITMCNQFFHEVSIENLESGTTYYYQIPAANGTTESDILSFTTAKRAGDKGSFSVAVLNDMGYTNAKGTHKQLIEAAEAGTAFAWHGGDISYADDWFTGIIPCAEVWPVCYNGTSTTLPPGDADSDYDTPLPEGEIPNWGGPTGGDSSVIYETNWDIWQQFMNNITTKIPYMVLPGNHEAACTEFDSLTNQLTAYLVDDIKNGTAESSNLTYYSCPPSQRNFTAYQHRFRMPGEETGGVGNFWYSFDYGLAHFVAIDGETDYAYSPEASFAEDTNGDTSTLPTKAETHVIDSGPFGAVHGSVYDNEAYAQYWWLQNDLARVDRKKTPWVFVMSHRPMYSSEAGDYMQPMRDAFEGLMLKHGVDAYFSGHIHWYERMWPMAANGTIDSSSVLNNNTYYTNPGVSMTHIVNGMAGNGESHSTIESDEIANITAVLDQTHYGFSKLSVVNEKVAKWEFIRGVDGKVGDSLTLIKGPGKGGRFH